MKASVSRPLRTPVPWGQSLYPSPNGHTAHTARETIELSTLQPWLHLHLPPGMGSMHTAADPPPQTRSLPPAPSRAPARTAAQDMPHWLKAPVSCLSECNGLPAFLPDLLVAPTAQRNLEKETESWTMSLPGFPPPMQPRELSPNSFPQPVPTGLPTPSSPNWSIYCLTDISGLSLPQCLCTKHTAFPTSLVDHSVCSEVVCHHLLPPLVSYLHSYSSSVIWPGTAPVLILRVPHPHSQAFLSTH